MSPTGACSGRAPRATQLQRTPTLHAFFPAVKQAFRQVPSGGGCRRPAGRLLRSHWHLPLPAALQQGDEGGASTSVGTVVDYDASAVNHVRIVGRLGRDVEVLAVGERALSLGRTRLAVKQPGGSGGTTGGSRDTRSDRRSRYARRVLLTLSQKHRSRRARPLSPELACACLPRSTAADCGRHLHHHALLPPFTYQDTYTH